MTNSSQKTKLTKAQRRKSMNCAYIAATSAVIGGSCVGVSTLNLVALKLGAKELYLGFLSFAVLIPFLCSVLTMSAIERGGKRKIMITWWSVTVILIIPFILIVTFADRWTAKTALTFLIIATLLKSTSDALASPGWFPILQDIVPSRITGRFFARIRSFWQSAGLIVLIGSAVLLLKGDEWWKFQLIFSIGLLGYITRVVASIPFSELPPADETTQNLNPVSRFKEFFAQKKLRPVISYICLYIFAATIAEPFKIKMLRDFGYSFGFILAATAMINLGAIISLRFWGKLADQFGNRPIFSISHIGMIITTLMWVLVEPSTFGSVLIFVLYLLSSIFHSGNGIAQTRYILHAIPNNKQNYINLINTTAIVAWSIAPLIGGLFLVSTQNFNFKSGAVNFNNYHMLFILNALLFVIPHILRKGLKSKKESSTSHVLTFVTRPLRNTLGPFIRTRKRDGGTRKIFY